MEYSELELRPVVRRSHEDLAAPVLVRYNLLANDPYGILDQAHAVAQLHSRDHIGESAQRSDGYTIGKRRRDYG